MALTLRIPLLWASLLALAIAGLVACAAAWFVLLSTICTNPRAPQAQQVIPYNCHGMTVFLSPLQDAWLRWNGPIGLLFGLLAFAAGAKLARAIAIQQGPRRRLRIFAIPPGEAPEWVREKWVGLELPLEGSAAPSRQRAAGVLSGPKGFLGQLAALSSGGYQQKSGFQVNVVEALAVLEKTSPEAAQWWRTNAPHLVKPSRSFLFSEHVGKVIE